MTLQKVQRAWGLLARGYSLSEAANAVGVKRGDLDLALWKWTRLRGEMTK